MSDYIQEVYSQTADGGYFDFNRCQKPNGSFYGTAGRCRIGTEVGAKSQNVQEQKMRIGGELDASEEELKVFYNSGPNNKKILEELVSNVPVGTRISIVKREFSEGAYVKTDFTTKSGHLVSTVIASKRFDFQVNQHFDVGSVKSHREGIEVANAVRRTFEALVKALPNGAVLETSAWSEDGHGKNRVRAYEKMGFSPPQRTKYGEQVEGQPGDPQFARKESGRMVSSSLSEKNSDQSYNFNEEIVSTILWYVAVFGIKPSFDADYSEVLDFTRCQRPNGTIYGTSGRCKSGTEIGAKEAPAAQKAGKLGGAKVGSEKRLLALSVDQLKQLRSDPRLYDYQKKKLDGLIAKKESEGSKPTTAAAKSARPVDPKVAAKVNKAMAAKAKGPQYTPEQKAAQDAYLKKQQESAAAKAEKKDGFTREERKADLRDRLKRLEEGQYNKTLFEVNASYKSMQQFVKLPGMNTPENMAALTAMRALRMKMVNAEIAKFRSKSQAKTEGLANSPKYGKTPGSAKPLAAGKLGEKATEYLSLKKAVEERQKKLDELDKLPWGERLEKGYRKLSDEQDADKGAMIRLSRQRDFIELGKIYEGQGYNAKPELVAKRSDLEKRDDLLRQPDGKPLILYRGVSQEEFADQFRGVGSTGGTHYPGQGIYGNGTYAASAPPRGGDETAARKTAKDYTGWEGTPAMITAFGLRKDANVVNFTDGDYVKRVEAYGRWDTDIKAQASQKTGLPINDTGHAAAIMGVHAYRVPMDTEDYWVVLNRGAVVAAADAEY